MAEQESQDRSNSDNGRIVLGIGIVRGRADRYREFSNCRVFREFFLIFSMSSKFKRVFDMEEAFRKSLYEVVCSVPELLSRSSQES